MKLFKGLNLMLNHGSPRNRSHVGMIIQSLTLDTQEKVIAEYGGKEWWTVPGKFLLGYGGGHDVGENGGEETHKLTVDEMPAHKHGIGINATGGYMAIKAAGAVIFNTNVSVSDQRGTITDRYATEYINDDKNRLLENTGGNGTHNNMPPYLTVYIWVRVDDDKTVKDMVYPGWDSYSEPQLPDFIF